MVERIAKKVQNILETRRSSNSDLIGLGAIKYVCVDMNWALINWVLFGEL